LGVVPEEISMMRTALRLGICSLAVSGPCAAITEYDFAVKQSNYQSNNMSAVKMINSRRYGDFYAVKILTKSGIPVALSEPNGSGSLTASFECDFSHGPQEGALTFSYHPSESVENSNAVVVNVHAHCIPLTEAERTMQIADEADKRKREHE